MKNQKSKPLTSRKAIAAHSLRTVIPQELQATISGGLGYKHLYSRPIEGNNVRSMQEFEAELATLGARIDDL